MKDLIDYLDSRTSTWYLVFRHWPWLESCNLKTALLSTLSMDCPQ